MHRSVLRFAAVLAGLAAASCAPNAAGPAAAPPQASAPAVQPNIVVILADDLGFGDLGVNGATLIRTPNIDGLAAQGVNFEQGYVTAAVCAPSRFALMTGRQQNRFGYEYNPRQRQELGIPEGAPTVPALLRTEGYRTALIGKWHLGQTPDMHPLNRGFDEFFGNTAGRNGFLVEPGPGDEWMDDPVQGSRPGFVPMTLFRGVEPVEVQSGYLTDILTDEAVAFIDRNKDRPFFLTVAHNAPHTPLQANAHYLAPYADVDDKATRLYAAMVSALDVSVGRIAAALEAAGVADRTLILFISDNGCAAYIGEGACSNAPFAGFKGTYFEGGIRIPMIARLPGVIEGGDTHAHPVSTMDWSATFLALGGVDAEGLALDGRSVTERFTTTGADVRDTLVWRTLPNFTVINGDWKLISMERADGAGQHVLLFNLADDPSETTDLAAAKPEEVARLTAIFEAWSSELPAPAFESQRAGSFALPDGTQVNIYN